MKHADLNQIAKRWLLRPESGKGPGCKVAFVEVGAVGDGERADAWGYRWGFEACSILVEVKVSRADFLRDKHKPHRKAGGMGDYRYYLCPEGIITLDDLPERWGLLWVNKRGHVKLMAGHICCLVGNSWGGNRYLAGAWLHNSNHDVERGLLAYMVHRVGDPDAVLQEQRGNLRLISQMSEKLVDIEKKERLARNEIRRLQMQLRALGQEVSTPSSLMNDPIINVI